MECSQCSEAKSGLRSITRAGHPGFTDGRGSGFGSVWTLAKEDHPDARFGLDCQKRYRPNIAGCQWASLWRYERAKNRRRERVYPVAGSVCGRGLTLSRRSSPRTCSSLLTRPMIARGRPGRGSVKSFMPGAYFGGELVLPIRRAATP